jgi:hypothetical protein
MHNNNGRGVDYSMSDEDELIDDVEETPNTDNDDDPTPGAYCTVTEVDSLCCDLSDEVPEQLFITAINNSTAWIDTNLKSKQVPIPVKTIISSTPTSSEITETTAIDNGLVNDESDLNTLRTAALYYAASDVILTLYHGEDLPAVFDVWFLKAESFLEAYIEAYWNSEAEQDELLNHQLVTHSKVQSYNQRRNRRRYF